MGTAEGEIIEIQGTGEERPFRRAELDRLLDLALGGIDELSRRQREALAATLEEVEAARAKGRRSAATPKDEKDLWSRPV